MKQLRILGGMTALFAALAFAQPAEAGFGHRGYGSYGSYGSSGGYGSGGYYAAGYGSSGYASYGSSGSATRQAMARPAVMVHPELHGSSGGYGSSGVAHVGPVRRLAARSPCTSRSQSGRRASYGSSGASYGSMVQATSPATAAQGDMAVREA